MSPRCECGAPATGVWSEQQRDAEHPDGELWLGYVICTDCAQRRIDDQWEADPCSG